MIGPITGAASPTARPATRRINRRTSDAATAAGHDSELVRRFNAGELSAFSEIAVRYRGRMFEVSFARLRNRSDAEEIAQDTLLNAYRALGRFRGDSSLSTWMHRIALNLSNNRYWHNFRRRRHATFSFDTPCGSGGTSTLADLIACEIPGPMRMAANGEFERILLACMQRLPAGQREILDHRSIQCMSYLEIARLLRIRLGTVKSRISRARIRLRELLAESCPDFGPGTAPAEWFEPARPVGRNGIVAP